MSKVRSEQWLHGRRDFTGERYGMLTVLSFDHLTKDKRGRTRRVWRCKCDCGKETFASSIALSRKWNTTCGCKSNKIKGKNNPNFIGWEEVSGKYFNSVRKGALGRGLEFNITTKDIWEQYLKQNGICAYSKELVSFSDKTASVDRINSNVGYVVGNIQIVHKVINIMKGAMYETEFIYWCQKVARSIPFEGEKLDSMFNKHARYLL